MILSIRRFRHLQTLTNRFVFSLAIADFMAGLFIFWQSCFSWFPELNYNAIACVFRFVSAQPSFSSAIHLVVIATDRYLAVLHPLRYHELMTTKVANILIAVAWISSVLLTAVIIGTAEYIPGVSICTLVHIVPHWVLIVVFHVVVTLLILAMFFMYGRIFWVARKQAQQIHAMELSVGTEDNDKSSSAKELKAAKQLSTIVFVYFLTHGLALLIGMGIGYNYSNIMSLQMYIIYYKIYLMTTFLNSGLNPIVYASKNKEFREAFKRILRPCSTTDGQGNVLN